jgi:prepilin-type N-terminal cleavage/methylation domain-containing protein
MKASSSIRCRGFTLIELLVVIAIIALIAGLAAPAFKTKSMGLDAGHRQLSDDLNRARLLAISTRSTVYMLFVPLIDRTLPISTGLTQKQKEILAKRQLRGYAIYSQRSVGSQPGQSEPKYLSEWKELPEGVCIATNKFSKTDAGFSGFLPMDYLTRTSLVTIPVVNGTGYDHIPYIAFDYTGALTLSPDGNFRTQNPLLDWRKDLAKRATIPLVSAAVLPVVLNAPGTPRPLGWEAAFVSYKSPNDLGGNYNALTNYIKRVVVDPLTGRSRVEGGQIQI